MWTKPIVTEIAVGMESNCYACAEIQQMSLNKDVRAAAKAHTDLTDKQINTMPLEAVILKLPIQIQKDLNLGVYGDDKMKRTRNIVSKKLKKNGKSK